MAGLKQTPLHSLHIELGARMVGFAGYEMPVQYPAGIRQEHVHTRTAAGLFDISHMGQLHLHGEDTDSFLETLVPADITGLSDGRQCYTILTNAAGGVIDDLMITRLGDVMILVVNAGCRDKDLAWLRSAAGGRVRIQDRTDLALLALQGPAAAAVLGSFCDAPSELGFGQANHYDVGGLPCLVHRGGYTGEDGFEISVNAGSAGQLSRLLLEHTAVLPCGLGARDSLRLEAGLCLYGHELDESVSPVEAGLGWTIAPRYRADPGSAKFPGADSILVQLDKGTRYVRTGIQPDGKLPVREWTEILDLEGNSAGRVTSGGFGPSLDRPVAMGFVKPGSAIPGTELQVVIRGRTHTVHTCKLPFIKHRYIRTPGD